ncbi:hypothetical protein A6A19_04250 [Actinobacillus delphinicola]|uniref:Uncharacterized protein conserved in bacteria n=1 Tax=Actinobacillus delphinicola TaxID=51161 RepID=A0A448TT19_9PAST|nr:accessory factor UbiK family protein [Actinobacillus delphinicola]MDG6897225.1 hypothetical protein [Actinobacillus delphinicola]VEJ09045.1 Uncharacterized protein conserved in bacteria [Actinobacillus delphinicola]
MSDFDKDKIENFFHQIQSALPAGLKEFSQDTEEKCKASFKARLVALGFVTKEEFEAQSAQIKQLQDQITLLQERLAALEGKQDQ